MEASVFAQSKRKVLKDADGNIIEEGLLEIMEQKGQPVTFDYSGNIMMVNNPKLRPNKNVQYTVVKEGDKGNGLKDLDQLDLEGDAEDMLQKLLLADGSKSKTTGQQQPITGFEGSIHSGDNTKQAASKEYHGQVMQALYSQPHKMMELKPGVQLNEGGKAYGGLSYNHARSNQQDLMSYKKSKDMVAE
jgi:hypothetical protein